MASKKCYKKNTSQRGVDFEFYTENDNSSDCDIKSSGTEYKITIKNHKSYKIAVNVYCKSDKDRVEFRQNGTSGSTYSEAKIVDNVKSNLGKIFSTPKPVVDDIDVEVSPNNVSNKPEEIKSEIEHMNVFTGSQLTLNEDIDVDVSP